MDVALFVVPLVDVAFSAALLAPVLSVNCRVNVAEPVKEATTDISTAPKLPAEMVILLSFLPVAPSKIRHVA